jgi:hypothetical protein
VIKVLMDREENRVRKDLQDQVVPKGEREPQVMLERLEKMDQR